MRRLLTILLVFGIIIGLTAMPAVAADKGVVKIRKGEPVHIAYWFVISGANTSLGMDTVRGCEIAIDDFGGKLKGHPVKLSGQDEMCNPEGGQAASSKIASDPSILAAIGSNCSSAATPGAPILWGAGIPTVSPSNTSPTLTAADRGEEFNGYLRTAHNDTIQGAVGAQFAFNKLKIKRAATVHDGSVYAEQLANVFAKTFKELGGTITAQEAVNAGDTDMRPVLTSISTGKPELLYLPIFIAEGGFITRQSKEVAGMEKVKLMGADGIFSPDFYKAAGEAAVGMYHTSPDFTAFGSGYKKFLTAHKDRYGMAPEAPFHAHSYDATMLILNAIDKVAVQHDDGSLTVDRMKLRDQLYATKDFKGLTGTLNCNENGDCADPRIAVYETNIDNVKKGLMPTTPFWKPY
ncbi:MAG: branched-chain amino acid ABC transporter substrate-binding protein [Desulfobacteraceae bacterium]|nr:branched-chain amino acid ABC transporter substrate-binding protein [Desulfobacteraceae bacterium]